MTMVFRTLALLATALLASPASAQAAQDSPPGAAPAPAAASQQASPEAPEAQPVAEPVVEPVAEPFALIREASETTLENWIWLRRPVVVFADNAADPRYVQQMDLLAERLDALEERDVVVITDTDPSARSGVRQKLRPRGFALVLIAKDGTIIARKPSPWSVREITRSIDKQPLRQQEIRDRQGSLR